MKVHVIVLDKHNAFPYWEAEYQHDNRLAIVKGRRFFSKGIVDRFHVNPDHIYNERQKFHGMKLRPLIIVDNATRTSVDPKTLKAFNPHKKEGDESIELASSVKMHSDNPVDMKEKNKLNYLVEKAFWLALLERVKTPLVKLLIHMFAGIGIWQFVRLILIALGFELSPM